MTPPVDSRTRRPVEPPPPAPTAPGAAGRGSPRSLQHRFDHHHNGLSLLRLLLALVVAVAHGLDTGFGWQPRIGGTDLAALAVDAFFVLSGYLMIGSWHRSGSLRRYCWHRLLRIMPAFWVCLVLTATVVAPLAAVLSDRPASSVFTDDTAPAWRYVTANAALHMQQFGIADLGASGGAVPLAPGSGSDGVINGSLWTLFYEALCYAAIAVLGVLGLLRRRVWLLAGATGLLWLALLLAELGVVQLPLANLPRLLFMFMLGALAALYAHHLPVHRSLAAAAAVVTGGSLLLSGDYRPWGAAAFAYLCLWAVTAVGRPQLSWDLSYGLYIWHWPVQVVLLLAGAALAGPTAYLLATTAVTLVVAALSWWLVERPALSLKSARWVTADPAAVLRPLRRRPGRSARHR